jgi:hypothetical protein
VSFFTLREGFHGCIRDLSIKAKSKIEDARMPEDIPLADVSELSDMSDQEDREPARVTKLALHKVSDEAHGTLADESTVVRRSSRVGRGQGGFVARQERISRQLEHTPRKRSCSIDTTMLDDEEESHNPVSDLEKPSLISSGYVCQPKNRRKTDKTSKLSGHDKEAKVLTKSDAFVSVLVLTPIFSHCTNSKGYTLFY